MAIYSDLVIDQGSYFSTIVNAAQNSVFDFDLTGYTARGTIRKSYTSTTYYPFDISIPTPTNGKITLSLESEVTAAIKAGRYLFDVEIIQTSNGRVTRIAEGQIEVMPGVTSGAYDPGNEVGQSSRDRLVNGANSVILGTDGGLSIPSGPGIIFDRNDTSINVGMGFHIRSGEGISLESVDLSDPDDPITRVWYFSTDGSVYVPTPNAQQYGTIKVSNLSDSMINWTFPNATGTLAVLNDQDDGNITIGDVSGLQSALDEQTFYTSSSDPTTSNIADGTFEMWKNSNTNVLKLWANDGGIMKSIALT